MLRSPYAVRIHSGSMCLPFMSVDSDMGLQTKWEDTAHHNRPLPYHSRSFHLHDSICGHPFHLLASLLDGRLGSSPGKPLVNCGVMSPSLKGCKWSVARID